MATRFVGFTTTLQFLDELADHNDREWFAENTDRYETCVREPALAFIAGG